MLRKPLVLIGCAMTALGLIGITYNAVRPGAGSAPGRVSPLTMRVTDARAAACRGGASVWTVGADLLTRAQPGARVTSAALRSDYLNKRSGQWHPASVVQQGTDTFTAGRVAGADGVLRVHPTVEVSLPCGVTRARLVAQSRLDCDAATRYAVGAFVSDGIAMSASSVGGLAMIAVVAALSAFRLVKPSKAVA